MSALVRQYQVVQCWRLRAAYGISFKEVLIRNFFQIFVRWRGASYSVLDYTGKQRIARDCLP
jgi:hypothetical protein